MLGQQFYHETVRNVIVAFGTMFNNINIVRKDNNGTITQSMKVPLAYGPKQKWLTRLDADPSLGSAVAITLPRLGFEIGSLSYDSTRKLNRVQKFKKVKGANSTQLDTQFMPVPYNLSIQLYVMAKQSDDALQIVEQILPYFQPDYTLTINDMADMGIALAKEAQVHRQAFGGLEHSPDVKRPRGAGGGIGAGGWSGAAANQGDLGNDQ